VNQSRQIQRGLCRRSIRNLFLPCTTIKPALIPTQAICVIIFQGQIDCNISANRFM
jgi:hypothetical protein